MTLTYILSIHVKFIPIISFSWFTFQTPSLTNNTLFFIFNLRYPSAENKKIIPKDTKIRLKS